MGKNAHIHLKVKSEFLENLKCQAKDKMLTLSEFCRLKISTNMQLDRIENKIDRLLKENENK